MRGTTRGLRASALAGRKPSRGEPGAALRWLAAVAIQRVAQLCCPIEYYTAGESCQHAPLLLGTAALHQEGCRRCSIAGLLMEIVSAPHSQQCWQTQACSTIQAHTLYAD